MTIEETIDYLEFMMHEEHVKADGIVPCNAEIALSKAIEALKETQWYPIDKVTPPTGGYYIIFEVMGDSPCVCTRAYNEKYGGFQKYVDAENITHWKPFPKVPKEGD